jgi:hypothetical protein
MPMEARSMEIRFSLLPFQAVICFIPIRGLCGGLNKITSMILDYALTLNEKLRKLQSTQIPILKNER